MVGLARRLSPHLAMADEAEQQPHNNGELVLLITRHCVGE